MICIKNMYGTVFKKYETATMFFLKKLSLVGEVAF